MTWHLTPFPAHEVFRRNPLVAVIAQVRFHPILKIADRISDFQESVRERFPVFSPSKVMAVTFVPPSSGEAKVDVREVEQFEFSKPDPDRTKVTVSTESLTVESLAHISSEYLLDDFGYALERFIGVFAHVRVTRLGLRYIDRIDREQIGRQLNDNVTWRDLLNEDFLRMPAELLDLDGTVFATEISSPAEQGAITLRYGLLRDAPDQKVRFRLDVDRYQEGAIEMEQIVDRLRSYTDDTYSIFRAAAAQRLLDWMEVQR